MNSSLKIDDFNRTEDVTSEVLIKYSSRLPTQIVDIWKHYGFGTFLDGYLKVVNPDVYQDFLKNSFELWDSTCITLFATSMADLIVLKNGYLYFLNFRYKKFDVIAKDIKFFFIDIQDEEFLDEELEWNPYAKAKEKLGVPAFSECFGYEPILAAGGSEKIEKLKKVKLIEHINLIVQFTGKI
ncbi:T6SS immunity protein Tdi1 domain-containing protein [Taibaiella soli]|uniref:DUF1851 domain-containing protein n=1 Tax=Taibaiella soli TaxID=1649169 RepID=A0A2W2AGA1_9BACT|nr:T6SS immunity protein Tdi1 domain-containing protein [Taibaiella soli]PZF71270.1 hypothetical protein DN068_18400 [Taibaiella soli]